MILTMVRAYDINDTTIEAVMTIFLLSNSRAYGISPRFVSAYIRARLGEEIHAANNDENVVNFSHVVPEFLEVIMPAADVMEALEWQAQDNEH